jgi:hypothetical protein
VKVFLVVLASSVTENGGFGVRNFFAAWRNRKVPTGKPAGGRFSKKGGLK